MQKRIVRFNYYTNAPIAVLRDVVEGVNNTWIMKRYPGSMLVLKKRRPIVRTDQVVSRYKYKITLLAKPEINNDTYIKAEMKMLYKAMNFVVRMNAWQP